MRGVRPQLEVSRDDGGWAKSTAGDGDTGEQREVGTMGPLASSLGERLQGRIGACNRTGVQVGGADFARQESVGYQVEALASARRGVSPGKDDGVSA